MLKYFKTILFLSLFSVISCVKEDDVVLSETVDPNPEAGVQVQDFMWKAMNFWYFWQADVENLADDKFPNTTEGSVIYTEFLASEKNPGEFFNNRLRFTEDRFSFFNDDYLELTQASSGITKSNGLVFGLVRVQDSDEVFGYVQYVMEGSDAATKNISRGDLFTGVNGETLFSDRLNEDNDNLDLLFGEDDTYTLNMATIVDGEVTPNGNDVTLIKQSGLQQNPIFFEDIIEIGANKIGYLIYNRFLDEYDEELNEVFGRFKSVGVTDLILDMRYNPGGSVNTATLISSMIYGANTEDVFIKAQYNEKYQAILEENGNEIRRFFKDQTDEGTPLNSLNLSRVYILTTSSSASASELVINGLEPYINVVQIGKTTTGKNEFSVTLVDDRENNYIFSPARVDQINPNNLWAIQPLLGRNENANGFSDYTAGLAPDIDLQEDLSNLGTLGDLSEPLLARAIQEITGNSAKTDFSVEIPVETFTTSDMFSPIKDNMYVADLPFVR